MSSHVGYMNIYEKIAAGKAARKAQFAVLIDPEKHHGRGFASTARLAGEAGVDFLFIGGSLLSSDAMDKCLDILRQETHLPLVIFPGSTLQVNAKADAILLLSLISGRNPDLLIGNHVIAAPYLRESGLEIIPTAYMLIESGITTTALYISNTRPIPRLKDDIAACTAMAGEMLGLKLAYLDAGSGAAETVPEAMVRKVRETIDAPIVVGGGIRSPEKARNLVVAGANLIVVGNAIEENNGLIADISEAIHQA